MSIKTKRLLTRANKLYNKGEIDQAEFIYKDILKSFSNNNAIAKVNDQYINEDQFLKTGVPNKQIILIYYLFL